jgi:hypothetical protein
LSNLDRSLWFAGRRLVERPSTRCQLDNGLRAEPPSSTMWASS